MPRLQLVLTNFDIAFLILCGINAILLFAGVGRFAIYNAVDSVLHLLFPKLSIKYNYRKYYPGFIKNLNGETMKAFQTTRDEYYPEYGPFHERFGDFFLRFPFFSLTIFLLLVPMMVHVLEPHYLAAIQALKAQYPAIPSTVWVPAKSWLFKLFAILFFAPFSSVHSTQVTLYAIVVYPFLVLIKSLAVGYRYTRSLIPAVFYSVMFALLFMLEVLLIYVGFLPMFHQGLTPFIENAAGLKQLIFWTPIKMKIYLDFILAPVVIVLPLVTTIGSYILAKNEVKEGVDDTNYLVLFYKTGIAYMYGPIFGGIFPKLKAESRAIRNERRINEILVICMYLESCVCVAGTGYAYFNIAQKSHISSGGIVMGLIVLLLFVPLIVFSSSGFQSYFLDKAVLYWKTIKETFVKDGVRV